LRRRGHTTQLSPSIGPRSTGLPRRLTRRRGARLLAEQRSFVQNYRDGGAEGGDFNLSELLMCFIQTSQWKKRLAVGSYYLITSFWFALSHIFLKVWTALQSDSLVQPRPRLDVIQIPSFFTLSPSHQFLAACMEY
jgi:hypothetical protein